MDTGSNAAGLPDLRTGKMSFEEAMERGMAAAQAGQKVSAYTIFKQIAELHPDRPEVWVWLGGTADSLFEAEAAFRRAETLDPNNEGAILGLRWVELRRQGSAQAEAGTQEQPVFSETASRQAEAQLDAALASAPSTGAATEGEAVAVSGGISAADVDAAYTAGASSPAAGVTGSEVAQPTVAPTTQSGMSPVVVALTVFVVLLLVGLLIWRFLLSG